MSDLTWKFCEGYRLDWLARDSGVGDIIHYQLLMWQIKIISMHYEAVLLQDLPWTRWLDSVGWVMTDCCGSDGDRWSTTDWDGWDMADGECCPMTTGDGSVKDISNMSDAGGGWRMTDDREGDGWNMTNGEDSGGERWMMEGDGTDEDRSSDDSAGSGRKVCNGLWMIWCNVFKPILLNTSPYSITVTNVCKYLSNHCPQGALWWGTFQWGSHGGEMIHHTGISSGWSNIWHSNIGPPSQQHEHLFGVWPLGVDW